MNGGWMRPIRARAHIIRAGSHRDLRLVYFDEAYGWERRGGSSNLSG